MKIFVTGGQGFLGRPIVSWLSRSHEVVSTDRDALDVLDASAVRRTLEELRPDVVCHLAALCGAQPSRERPTEFFAVNAQGTVNVLEGCRQAGVQKFLFTSSMTVYGEGDDERVEDSPFAPRHPYAMSKVAAEYAVLNYCRCFGLKAIVLRPTLVVGEGYKEPHAIGDFVQTAVQGGDIVLFGGGMHRRDFVHPEDVAQAVAKAVDRLADQKAAAHETFNISSGQAFSLSDLADLVLDIVGDGRKVVGPISNQTFSLYTSIEHARSVLGYEPRIPTEAIIHRLLKLYHHKGAA